MAFWERKEVQGKSTDASVTLGREYKDKVTGFQGIAIAKTSFLYSCERVTIQPQELKDGKQIDTGHFDVHQLVDVGPGISAAVNSEVATIAERKEKTGGYGSSAPRQSPVMR